MDSLCPAPLVGRRKPLNECIVAIYTHNSHICTHTHTYAHTLTHTYKHTQVLFLGGENAVLIDRTQNRRIDPDTDKVYHMGGNDALSPKIEPKTANGAVDKEVVARWVWSVCLLFCFERRGMSCVMLLPLARSLLELSVLIPSLPSLHSITIHLFLFHTGCTRVTMTAKRT